MTDNSSSSQADLPYRPCAGMMVVNNKRQVFVGRRIDMVTEHWQMPQGGIDHEEDPLEAAYRELEEEIGTRNVELIHRLEGWFIYDLPEDLIGKIWKGKYRGQKQKWFLFRFLGEDNEINIRTEHPEFSEWKWAELVELPQLIVPFKRDLYETIIQNFKPYI
ncbi:MAG: RNA pyrophosphohydrolase [Sneathiella sp.]|nr:RNA pyrophosphohydrolase [Sneathiella sp.]